MNSKIDNGKSRNPSRVRRRFRAPSGSDSVRMMRTIPRSPSALAHRFKATREKSDQAILTTQNIKYNKIRTFFLNSGPTLPLLAMSTARAANNRKMKIFRSIGLPST